MLSERYIILKDGTCPPCKDGDVTGNDPHGYEAVESGDVEKTSEHVTKTTRDPSGKLDF